MKHLNNNMMSKLFKKMMELKSEEKSEKFIQSRIKYRKSLSLEYQLGMYVGDVIISRFLPSLNIDLIKSKNVIDVSKEDYDENKRLYKEWVRTSQFGTDFNNVDRDGDKEKWGEYERHNKLLRGKYIPQTVKCHLSPLNVENVDLFKMGIIETLWNCEVCDMYSNITPEDILIHNDDYHFYTIIELKRNK